ncbi:class I SAM-dependent methyltransferase [Aquisalimonas sp. 2447]|uniref:class I SAM-dependent methyltransferase n=1 Tax=Aquisalimonas sp. 2447 TaxID=2740807 RepID=UPI0014323251|nr:class I SAM-dependent methyltransferase [Aquisalimonas sp. 2447]QIT55259.1 class I SAM-dependent methyltransferase [Aquisalimonas sp. 2447]
MDAETYNQWYETPRGQWIAQREVELLLRGLQPHPGESLLDVGCGTGYFTRALASAIGGPTTGVDISPDMVAYARRRETASASYVLADARSLPYAAASFDLVVSIAALCFVEEERAAVQELVRVARRRVAMGLLNRRSVLWFRKGRNGGSGSYQGAHWHTTAEAAELFEGLPVKNVHVRTAVHLPGGGRLAQCAEPVWPQWLRTGAFVLVVADISRDSA